MAKQTAVDWLIEQLKEYDFADIKDSENYIIKIPAWVLTEKQERAKQMEKEQLIAFGYTQIQYVDAEIGDCIYKKVPEEIYNETYSNS